MREGGREGGGGYRGKEAKHPSAFNSVNWINAKTAWEAADVCVCLRACGPT